MKSDKRGEGIAMRKAFLGGLVGTLLAGSALAQARPGEAEFRSLYKELVETNTTLSTGSCTLAAERMGRG